jgi:hypothetical protein
MVAFSLHRQKSCAHAQWKKLWTAGGKKVLFYLLEYFNGTYYIITYSIYCFCCSHPLKNQHLLAITCIPPKIEIWRVVISSPALSQLLHFFPCSLSLSYYISSPMTTNNTINLSTIIPIPIKLN